MQRTSHGEVEIETTFFLVHVQCRDQAGCFPCGKPAATARRYPASSCFLFTVFSCLHTTGCESYSFTTDGYGIFNMRTHEGGSGTNESGKELTRKDRKNSLSVSPFPARGSNPGYSDLNTDALTPEQRTSPVLRRRHLGLTVETHFDQRYK